MVIKSKKEPKAKAVKSFVTSSTAAASSSRDSHQAQSHIRSPLPQTVSGTSIAGVTITEVSDAGHGTVESSKCVVVQPDIVDNLLLGEGKVVHGATQVVHFETTSGGRTTSEFIKQEQKSSSTFETKGETTYTVGDTIVTEVSNPITKIIDSEYSSQSSYSKFDNAGTAGNGNPILGLKDLHGKQIKNTSETTSSDTKQTSEQSKSTSFEGGSKQSRLRLVDDKFNVIDNTDTVVEKLAVHDKSNILTSTSTSHMVETTSSSTSEQKTFDRNKGNWDGSFTYERQVDAGHTLSQAGNLAAGSQTSKVQKKSLFTSDNIRSDKDTHDGAIASRYVGDSYADNIITSSSSHDVIEKVEKLGGHEYDVKYSVAKSHSNKNISENITEQQYTSNVVFTQDLKSSASTHTSDFKEIKQISDIDFKNTIKNSNRDSSLFNADYSTVVDAQNFGSDIRTTSTDYSTVIDTKNLESINRSTNVDYSTVIDSKNVRSDSSKTITNLDNTLYNIENATIINSKNLRSETYAPDNLKTEDTITTYTSKVFDDKTQKWYVVDESTINEGNILSSESRSDTKSTSKITNKSTNEPTTTKTTKIVNNKKLKDSLTSAKNTANSTASTSNQTTISQQIYDEKTKTWTDVDEKTYKNRRPSLMRYVSKDNSGKFTTIYKKKVFDKRTGSWKVVEEKCYKNNYFNEHIPEVIDDVTNTTTTTYVTKVFDTKTNTWKIVDEQSFTDTKTVVPADIAEEIARDQADIANIITTTEITKVEMFNIFFMYFYFCFFILLFLVDVRIFVGWRIFSE